MARRGGDASASTTTIPQPDFEEIDALTLKARAGDSAATPPRQPTTDAPEIGRRVVQALDFAVRDKTSDDVSRSMAYRNLRWLATKGAADLARRLLRQEAPFQIRRNGNLTTMSSRFSVPTHLVERASTQDSEGVADVVVRPAARQYVQIDFQTWEVLTWLRDHLAARRDGLDATVIMLDEILKLRDIHPGLSPRDAMLKAGLDPATMQLDLDVALASLDADVGVRESTG